MSRESGAMVKSAERKSDDGRRGEQKDGVPSWFRVLFTSGAVLVWTLILVGSAVVSAFRATEGPRVSVLVCALTAIFGAVCFAKGGPILRGLSTLSFRFARSRAGATFLLLGALVLAGWLWSGLGPNGIAHAEGKGRRVAIVGAGSAGMHAAWMLDTAGVDFELYEAADYIGGHAFAPVYRPLIGEPFACDIGFIFGSPTDYQEMKVLMDWYGVRRNPSELGMSANVDGRKWASGPAVSEEAKRFMRLAQEQHQNPAWNLVPFGTWLSLHDFSEEFRGTYLTPMMSVLFITDLGLYNVSTRFMLNMAAGRMQWIDFEKGAPAWTVEGGSVAYYSELAKEFPEKIHLKSPIVRVERREGRVFLRGYGADQKPFQKTFDDVILAVPADVASRLVVNKDWLESFVLDEVRYKDSEVVLHTDQSLLPSPELRRQYNYYQDSEEAPGRFELTGIMNLVHGRGAMSPLPLGSLNPLRPIDPEKVLLRRGWRHHSMDLWHLALMLEVMPKIQGRGGVWYAGDWVTVIGHGPAMRTGMAAACSVGAKAHMRSEGDAGRCIDVRTEEARAGKPELVEHLCGKEEIFRYFVERNCNGFRL